MFETERGKDIVRAVDETNQTQVIGSEAKNNKPHVHSAKSIAMLENNQSKKTFQLLSQGVDTLLSVEYTGREVILRTLRTR